jgi:hypothetical protein
MMDSGVNNPGENIMGFNEIGGITKPALARRFAMIADGRLPLIEGGA